MREYVHLHRKALASWVFEDPRRWHLFSFLLMKADERGRVEVSVNSYCSTYHLPRTTVLRLIEEMESRELQRAVMAIGIESGGLIQQCLLLLLGYGSAT